VDDCGSSGRNRYRRPQRLLLAALALTAACGVAGTADAQTCTVSNSSVALTNGTSCSIAPSTTLTGNVPGVSGSPEIYATDSSAPISQITTNNVTLRPNNGGSTGGLASTNGIIIFSPGPSINGNWATAASAQNGGEIIFQSGSAINPAFGGGGKALLANGVNSSTGQPSQIIATGLTVSLNGAGSNIAADATGGGVIMLNTGTTITYAEGGGGNTGLLASGAGSEIVTNGVILTMPGGGGNDTGAEATGGASVALNNSTVAVTGNGGNEKGLFADGAGSSITGTDTTITVSSKGGPAVGGVLDGGASIALTGGSVTTSGTPGSYGFLFQAPAGSDTLSLNGTTVTSAADAFAVQSGTATINTVGATVTGNPYSGNNGILLSVINGATATMTSDSSTLTGAITTASGSTSNVTLSNGTLWNMTASSNATNMTDNDSTINMLPPTGDPTQLASYKTLTVMNYTGTGGEIVMNTYLGADGSPSDQLVINGGTATGTTSLTIHNTTGPGDQTTANGILVVNAINGATTAPGSFVLDGEARGGAYDYYLFQGGINGSTPNDWYLRSTFPVPAVRLAPLPVPPPPPPQPAPAPPSNVLPSDPPPTVLPSGLYPIIGPELATYGVVQPTARELGLETLGTLHQRIGDTLTTDGGDGCAGWACSEWGRVFGQLVDNRYQAFADPYASGWMGGFQGGVDLWRGSALPGSRDAAGIYVAYGNAAMSVNGLVTNAAATAYILTHTGTVNLDAFSAGGYWTHYGPGGWYLDAVLQGSYYGGGAATQYAHLPINGTGFISSLEGGYPIPLPLGPRFVLEPQGQIIWQLVSFLQANDGLGPVALGTTSGPTGRLGVRGMWTIDGENSEVWQPYVRANLWRDWDAQATTVFGGDAVPLIEQATRLEFAAGVTAKLNPRLSLYGQAGYQFAVGQTNNGYIRDGVEGDFGLRYTW
jgi:outer membrane autotransporter protein